MDQTIDRLRWLWRTPAGLALSTASLFFAGYTTWILSTSEDATTEALVSTAALIYFDGFFTALGLWLASRKTLDIRLRRGWFALALAVGCNMVAEGLWYYYENILQVDPFPSLADLFYLLYYPLTLAGVIAFPFTPVKPKERTIYALDLGIVLLSSAIVMWYFILSPIQVGSSNDLGGMIAVAYPVGDLLIFAGIIALIERDVEKIARKALLLLAGGLFFMTLADILFGYLEVNAIPYSVPYLNILYMASSVSFIAAASYQIITKDSILPDILEYRRHATRLLRLALPYLAAAVPLLLIVYLITPNLEREPRLQGLLYGSMSLMVLVFLRQSLVLKENALLYKEMERMAITDSLTQVYNRHFFNETLTLEMNRARRYAKPLSILLVDIDQFKSYNDTYGHLRGDQVLRNIAQILADQLRQSDVIARFGGDEFIVILPETECEGAQVVANKMKNAIATHPFDEQLLSISVGMAAYSPGRTPIQMLERVDQDLYHQKPKTHT